MELDLKKMSEELVVAFIPAREVTMTQTTSYNVKIVHKDLETQSTTNTSEINVDESLEIVQTRFTGN